MGSSPNEGPFKGRVLRVRVTYYVGDLKERDPTLENYPYAFHVLYRADQVVSGAD